MERRIGQDFAAGLEESGNGGTAFTVSSEWDTGTRKLAFPD